MDKYTETKLKKSINQRSVYYMNKKTHSKTKVTLSLPEQRKLVKDVNETALYLYNYYVTASQIPHFNLLNDSLVGRAIGWSARKVKDNRLKLSKAKWIYFHQVKHKGVIYSAWVFGEEEIERFKSNAHDISITETVTKDGNYMHASIEKVENVN